MNLQMSLYTQSMPSSRMLGSRPTSVQNVVRCPRARQQVALYAQATTVEVRPAVETYVSKEARKALFATAQRQVEVEARVSGTIPSWLNGSFLANGGAEYKGMTHMFDGYAMLCKLRFSDGKVFGSQEHVNTKAFRHFKETGKMLFREFATGVPAVTAAEKAKAFLQMMALMAVGKEFSTDNSSVNVVPLPNGTVLTLSESRPSVYRVDPNSLKTIGQHQYNDGIPGDLTTAHPKVMADGTVVNFTRSLPFGGYHVYKQDPVTLKRTQIAFIRDRNPMSPCWVHDITISQDHLVIVEPPIFINMASLVTGAPASHAFMDWKPELGTQVHVVPLTGDNGTVRTYQAPAFFSFHTANAFEEGGYTHVDLSVYDDPTIITDLNLENLLAFPGQNVSRSYLRRISIPHNSTSKEISAPQQLIKDESGHGYSAEFLCVSSLKRGLKHQYVWGNGSIRPTNMVNALTKFDVESGDVTMWHEDGSLPGEPVFVAAPGATQEDEGVLLSVVMSRSGTSFMLVLDAATMQELGRAALPYAVPYRFHGCFVREKRQ